MAPQIRPVAERLLQPSERAALADVTDSMLAYGLRYAPAAPAPVFAQQTAAPATDLPLKPAVDRLCAFQVNKLRILLAMTHLGTTSGKSACHHVPERRSASSTSMRRCVAQGMPRAGRPLCEAVQQMVMGAMQIEAIRRHEEVRPHFSGAAHAARPSRLHSQISLATALNLKLSCALMLWQAPPAQGRGALEPSPGARTAAPPTTASTGPGTAGSRAGADSTAASQSVIPLTVAERAKAAAAAMGAHRDEMYTCCTAVSTIHVQFRFVYPRCRWREGTEDSEGAGHLAGRTEGSEGAVWRRRAARSCTGGVCRCFRLLLH